MDNFCGSIFWDSNTVWNTQSLPAFSLCFSTLVSIVPCVFLLLFTPIDVYLSYTSDVGEIPWSVLNIGKISVATMLIILELGLLVVSRVVLPNVTPSYVSYPVDLYAPAAYTTTLMLYILLLLYSKRKGVRSSGVQFMFWFLFTCTQALKFRTVIASYYEENGILMETSVYIIQVMYFPLVFGQFILHCWADVDPEFEPSIEKQANLPHKKVWPENGASFLSKLFFHWYTTLLWKGYRKPLELSDLWELNLSEKCQSTYNLFNKYWSQKFKSNSSKSKESGVFVTMVKAFGWTYIGGVFLRCWADVLIFISPVMLRYLINFVESDEPTWKGVLYAVLLFVSAFAGTMLNTGGNHIFYKAILRAKSAITGAVFRKTLVLSNSSRKAESVGEIVNHMAVDVQYATDAFLFGWVLDAPFVITAGLYFLWDIIGVSAISGVILMLVILPLNGAIANKVQALQKLQMENKDKRIKLTSEILSGIKILKLYAWEPSFENKILKIRQEELRILKQIAFLNAIANALWMCAPFLVAVFSFATFVLSDSSNVLDAQTAFVSLSLLNIMTLPASYLAVMIACYVQAVISIRRLNKFLNSDEIDTSTVSHDQNSDHPLIIENGSFSWKDDITVLHDINLQVKDGELVAVVGQVGAGKSSLISAFLNELTKTNGRVNTRGSIAYVPQQAWIQNATLRNNILFGKPYDPIKYNTVINACALKPDLDIMPAGDRTEIGEKGVNLSGGQKQRVSLARAAYCEAEIYLLDDPLSAVDAHVGKHIFEKLIGPNGLLRNKTRLFVTHGVVYLPFMNNIVVMSEGKISESGSYQELMNNKGEFAEYLTQHLSQNESEESLGKLEKQNVHPLRKRTLSSESDNETCEKRSMSIFRRQSLFADKLIETEEPETDKVKVSIYMEYFRAVGTSITICTIVLYIFSQGCSIGANFWLSEWTRLPTINGTRNDSQGTYLSVYGAFGFMQAVSILLATLCLAYGNIKSSHTFHIRLLHRILRAPSSFFDVTPIGRIVNRFAKDIDSIDNQLPVTVRVWLNGVFGVLSVLVVICISTPIFIGVIVPVGIFYYFSQIFYLATSRQLKRLESTTRSPIFSHFGESICGSSSIRAYNEQGRFILESEKLVDENMTCWFTNITSNRWLQVRLEIVGSLVVFFAALFAVLGRDTLNPGIVGLSVSYSLQITTALIILVRLTADVENSIVAVERLQEYCNVPQEPDWKIGNKISETWPENGEITLNEYKTRYRPGLELVLQGVTCTIKSGEKVGIVGRTGAGKSSMTLALFRLIESAGGSICIDGQNISRLGLHDVRGRITIIPQDPVLFSGSLRMNLDPFELQADETVYQVLEQAHLKNFVATLPEGLEYEIAEGGENLSVGQRQLVCLARALLRKTKILVLDEATAAVDLDTDDLIQQTIRHEFKECTVITIAHRLNTIMDSDRVMVLDKGQIKEFDTPEKLLSDDKTLFYSMAKEAGIVCSINSKL